MKNDYLDDVANKISKYLPEYQNCIQSLKDNVHGIIRYIGKSFGFESLDTRISLAAMDSKLKE
ncbi:hypothetical protein DFQ29_001407, partial [Apophysomyces sp. BC1021]